MGDPCWLPLPPPPPPSHASSSRRHSECPRTPAPSRRRFRPQCPRCGREGRLQSGGRPGRLPRTQHRPARPHHFHPTPDLRLHCPPPEIPPFVGGWKGVTSAAAATAAGTETTHAVVVVAPAVRHCPSRRGLAAAQVGSRVGAKVRGKRNRREGGALRDKVKT